LRQQLHEEAARLAPEVESAAFELALEVSHAWERFRETMDATQ
jgi:hypothetical protein